MVEIKISELSIGDWVMNLYANKPSRVIGLRTMFQDTYEIIAVSDDTQYMLIEDNEELHNFEPIRLTPAILEKNGFVREDTESGIKYTFIEGNTMFCGTWAKSVFQWTFPMDFRFVHHLQHALRLAGVEKEIEV